MSISYLGQKFSEARRALMLPHPSGEAESIAAAIVACAIALDHVRSDIPGQIEDTDALHHLRTIESALPARDLGDPKGVGTALVKAQAMTEDEQRKFATAVDALANWAWEEFWSGRAS